MNLKNSIACEDVLSLEVVIFVKLTNFTLNQNHKFLSF